MRPKFANSLIRFKPLLKELRAHAIINNPGIHPHLDLHPDPDQDTDQNHDRDRDDAEIPHTATKIQISRRCICKRKGGENRSQPPGNVLEHKRATNLDAARH